ncbi:hypothetical protein ILUMI_16129 [Ignelater luminosus]|uniref:Uncharacterized protein n=1 Tax=Ignelater luminosus TaxID=2038154 RepID=A0A8K0CP64_IGNLU|nr:hypothetical protein ILUMI_16129 [Ignelater luminosus]
MSGMQLWVPSSGGISKHHGGTALVVYDGYPDQNDKSIKSAERERRKSKCSSVFVVFAVTMPATMANERNNNALQLGQQSGTAVIVIREDVDLLTLLTAAASVFTKIYLLKPEKGKQADMFYSSLGSKCSDKVKNNILLLHVFGCCDSTSVTFGKPEVSKMKLTEQDSSIATLYSGSSKMSLNEIRYGIFSTALVKKVFNLASLPPTEAAAPQHSLRTHLQIEM